MTQVNEVGFEAPPQGALFARHVNFRGPIGLAYERCIHYRKDFHVHDRWNFVFPRGSSKVKFTLHASGEQRTLDAHQFLVMPPALLHRQESTTLVYDVVAFMARPQEANRLAPHLPDTVQVFARSRLLAELVHRAFSSVVVEERELGAVEWILQTILREISEITASSSPKRAETSSGPPPPGGVSAALHFIEANLFSALSAAAIARHARVSSSSLFRLFQKEVGTSPLDYIRRRRMEEARLLLASGRHTVQEVCHLVGYEDPVSFSKSFKALFGKTPSQVAERESGLPARKTRPTRRS